MTRRRKGEGTVSQRKDGRWEARLDLGIIDGVRKFKSFYGSSDSEVLSKLRKAQVEFEEKGHIESSSSQTFERFMTEWLTNDARLGVEESTYLDKERNARKHIIPLIGKKKLRDLKPSDIQRVLAHSRDKGLSPRMVQMIRGLMRQALARAVAWDLIPKNPAAATGSIKVPRKIPHTLGADEARRFLTAIRRERLWALYLLAVTTGLRRGELLGLRWQDIDLERKVLTIRCNLSDKVGRPRLKETKTTTSRRPIALSSFEVAVLVKHRAMILAEKEFLGSAYTDNDMVFCHQDGTFIWPHNFSVRTWRSIRKKAGLPDKMDFHDLRHSAATICLELGIPLKVVQERMGHANAAFTATQYQHALQHIQDDAAAKLGDFFGTLDTDLH